MYYEAQRFRTERHDWLFRVRFNEAREDNAFFVSRDETELMLDELLNLSCRPASDGYECVFIDRVVTGYSE